MNNSYAMSILLTKCKEGIKANVTSGLILQVFGLAIVLGFYYIPAIHNFCQQISSLKTEWGIWFSCFSTCLAGGIIPVFLLITTGKVSRNQALKVTIFYVVFWFWKGAEINIFYDYQAVWFGDSPSASTITYKVLVDQFLWSPLYAAPCLTLCFAWKDCDFSFARFKRKINRDMLLINIPSVVVSTWVVWIPMCSIIYSLPTPLQVPLFNIVLCFFVLMVTIVCDHKKTTQTDLSALKQETSVDI